MIELHPWSAGDLSLLEKLLGDPAMTEHLGGPETHEHLVQRNARYSALDGTTGWMFKVTLEPGSEVGSVGYWEREWRGEVVGAAAGPRRARRALRRSPSRLPGHLPAIAEQCRRIGPEVWPRFEQDNGPRLAFSQPRRHYRSRRTAPHDGDIELLPADQAVIYGVPSEHEGSISRLRGCRRVE